MLVLLCTAPSGPPGPITLVTVTPNSATVQWGEVPCLQRNGEITDYTATATNSDGMEEGTASVDVDARQATISGLTPSTQYIVSVAAVNSTATVYPRAFSEREYLFAMATLPRQPTAPLWLTLSPPQTPPTWWALFRVGCPRVLPSF